jgi:hypothetical protein
MEDVGMIMIIEMAESRGRRRELLEERYLTQHTRVYPEVSGLAVWSENCKWYSSLPLGAVVSLFCESV